MSTRRLSMRQIREILRLVYEVGLPARAVARTVRCTHPTVRELVRRFESAGGQWPLPDNLTDSALEEWLYPRPSGRPTPASRTRLGGDLSRLAPTARHLRATLAAI